MTAGGIEDAPARRRRGAAPYPVRVRGVVYPSARDAAEALGVHVTTVRKLVSRGRADMIGTGKGALMPGAIRNGSKPFSVGALTWPSVSEAARALGYRRPEHFRKLIREGRHDLIMARAMQLEARIRLERTKKRVGG